MLDLTASWLLFATILILLTCTILRLIAILPVNRPRSFCTETSGSRTRGAHLLIILGSGGHTSEMLALVRNLDPNRYAQRTYIVSSADSFSASRAVRFEQALLERRNNQEGNQEVATDSALPQHNYLVVTVPRARRIHQSLWTTTWSSLMCLFVCVKLLAGYPPKSAYTTPKTKLTKFTSPDLILTNGPATGVIVVLASVIVRYFGLQSDGQMKTVFVESWARVNTLSLSGKILLHFGLTDRFFVQWEALRGGRKEWRGFLVI